MYVHTLYKTCQITFFPQAEFTDIDFAVMCPSPTPSVRPSYYHELQTSGIQAFVTQDCSTISLVNVVKAARGSVKIYAGLSLRLFQLKRINNWLKR